MKYIRIPMLVAMMALLFAVDVQAQDLHPSRRLSPLGMARSFVGDVYVKVTFSQPYKRDRDNIIGAGDDYMHSYGNVWRFGANEPTEISFSGPVMVGDARVEAGTYSVFSRPGASSWMIYINSLRGGGAGDYDEANNVATLEVPVTMLDEEADQFSIALEEQGDGLHMVTMWLDWKLEVPIMPAK